MSVSFSRAGRYLRTTRHLRMRQLGHQLLRRIRHCPEGARNLPALESMPELRWPAGLELPEPSSASALHDQRAILSGELVFQNRLETVGFPPDWNITNAPRLWRYHLHYHEFLWLLDFAHARAVVLHWIANHRLGPGQVGWEPYPTSLRLANWCAVFFGHHRAHTIEDETLCATLWASICEQAAHLQRSLEWHLLGNHLLENGVALALAGSCFAHSIAQSWFRTGYKILQRQLQEQILQDGGHIERSPMYGCRILYDLLLLNATRDGAITNLVRPYLKPVATWLAAMTHPDGEIALMNDSAFGISQRPSDLIRRSGSRPARIGTFVLAESGYFTASTSEGHYVICDAGPIGPDYLPGHGHADLFSFELSLYGKRVVVDSGVSSYEADPMRDYCRSTRAHNTVEIAGQNQVELWSTFRVGRRCKPRDVKCTKLSDGFELKGTHDGYHHLPGRPTHTRMLRWRENGSLTIVDQIDSTRPVPAVARIHFHPDCRIDNLDNQSAVVDFPGGRILITGLRWSILSEDDSYYCPAFGVVRANPCLAFSSLTKTLSATIRIELL